ncbi:MAG TPA: hypothetical protein VEI95_13545 [Acidobacteriota bacterium]|nr:hypothetical protein [Acidobacteriota bacterium]
MRTKLGKNSKSKANRERQPFWTKAVNPPRAPMEEKALAVFQPDVLIESQYQATQTRQLPLNPERVLMLAVLRDAVSCYQDHVSARKKIKRSLHRDAEEWIFNRDRSHLFSFDNLCEALGYDPDYMRAGLCRWKEAVLERQGLKEEVNPLAG